MSLAGHAGAEGRCLSSDTYLAKLLQGLQHLRSQNALCDVTLEAGGLSFPAHKAVLASASSYCKMRFSGAGAGPDAPLQLAGVTAGGLRNVLAFVYSNRLELTLRTVEETLAAAEALLVREVVRLCFQFLEEALDGRTCLEVLRIAKRLGPEELRQKARRCVGRHCGEILADLPRLRGLDRETLCEILEGAGAEAPSELELFRAAVRWLRHDPTRGKDAAEILRRLRLPLVPSQELQEFGREMAPTEMEPACRQYFQEALDYHARLYAQPALQSERTQVRAGADTLLVLGGRTADNVVCADIWAADQSSRSWEKLGDLPGPLYNHCVAVIHDFLFVMGGQDRFDPTGQCPSNKVFRLDPRHDTWLQVASMLERRTRFHAGVLNDRLVAVGGGALLGALSAAAEEYQPAENEWRPIVSFPVPVADHAGATHKGIFYVSACLLFIDLFHVPAWSPFCSTEKPPMLCSSPGLVRKVLQAPDPLGCPLLHP
ncbi:kelch-like protein 13 isoform X2 [Hemicordylus capensis]|uniref:kelch-like protein 13 isoform X2 n=1 Tax=Hemicordylus capensis TaxID=884348 RepID=UPI002302E6C9|nr:kelch-like protein 13 isoform X2 [Hemicordylus capensis]